MNVFTVYVDNGGMVGVSSGFLKPASAGYMDGFHGFSPIEWVLLPDTFAVSFDPIGESGASVLAAIVEVMGCSGDIVDAVYPALGFVGTLWVFTLSVHEFSPIG